MENGSYGRELPLRASALLRELEPAARKVQGERPSEGSLYVTFLLSMAMPIIIQPYESFFVQKTNSGKALKQPLDGYEQGSRLELGLEKLRSADDLSGSPFEVAKWRFAYISANYTLADGVPERVENYLNHPDAEGRATGKSPKAILELLRNSLAHGAILYLDQDEKPSIFGPVEHFLFVNKKPGKSTRIEFLKVSVEDFKEFIIAWAAWLENHGGSAEGLQS